MELLTFKSSAYEYTYYLDDGDCRVRHGEFRDFFGDGSPWERTFYFHNVLHGEYILYQRGGTIISHAFYINGKRNPYVEMSEHEKLLFQIKYPGFRFIED